jgi:hypothetical protein
MKSKFLFICLIILSSSKVFSTDHDSKEEIKEESAKIITKVLPPEIFKRIVIENPEILPDCILTCKKWYRDSQNFIKETNYIYHCLSKQNMRFYQSYFKNLYGYSEKDYIEKFKSGFKKLVFNKGKNIDEDDILLSTNKILNCYFKQCSSFSSSILADYEEKFKFKAPSETLHYNFLKIFNLCHDEHFIMSNDNLEKLYLGFKALKDFNALEYSQDSYEKLFGKNKTRENLLGFLDLIKIQKLESQPLIGLFYKLSLLNKQVEEVFYNDPPSLQALLFIRNIPVNLSLDISEEIEKISSEIEKRILTIAHRRWIIINQLNAYRKLG